MQRRDANTRGVGDSNESDNLREEIHEPVIMNASVAHGLRRLPVRFKVTVPEPFKMTLREEIRQVLRRSRRINHKSGAEEPMDAECLRQFRARPVPANTFLPLYEKMTKDKEAKRREAREQHKAKVMSQVQLFGFVERETKSGRRRRSMSVPNMLECLEGEESLGASVPSKTVRPDARAPHETELKTSLVGMSQQKKTECHIKDRAEKLPKIASSPQCEEEEIQKTPIRELSGTRSQQYPEDQIKRARATPKATQQSSREVRRTPRPATSGTERARMAAPRPSSLNRVSPLPKDVKHRRRETELSRIQTGTSSESDDLDSAEMFPPPKMTLASLLRESVNRKRAQDEKEFKENVNRNMFRKQKEELELKQMVVSKSRNFKRNAENVEERRRNFRDADKARLEEYRQEIKKMMERLKSRPLLMERQSQLSAVRKVDKRFRQKLCQEGLDESLVLKYSERATGTRSSSCSSVSNEGSGRSVAESIERSDDDSSDTSGNENEDSEGEYSTFEETSDKTLQGEDDEKMD